MTQEEKIKAEIENRIKEHKKQLRRKDLTVVSEAAMKGSLGAYESLLNYIERMNDGLSPEDKMMKAIYGDKWKTEAEREAEIEKAVGRVTDEEYKRIWGKSIDESVQEIMDRINDIESNDRV